MFIYIQDSVNNYVPFDSEFQKVASINFISRDPISDQIKD